MAQRDRRDRRGATGVPRTTHRGEAGDVPGIADVSTKLVRMANSSRMTSYQRREQLIRIGRSLFAAKGFEAVSVEEIASHAKVSKPIVYEHFGGKEGLYAVIVDREMQALTATLTAALEDQQMHPRQIVERTALALLTYIEQNAEGFQVLSRDSPSTDPSGSFSSLLGDISLRVEDLLTAAFKRQKLSSKGVPYYAQMLVGMTVFTGQYWADRPKVDKEQLAAYIVDLAWHGLSRLDSKPKLIFEGERAARTRAKEERRNAGGPEASADDGTDAGAGTGGPGTDAGAGAVGPGTDAGAGAGASTGAGAETTAPAAGHVAGDAGRTADDATGSVADSAADGDGGTGASADRT